MIGAIAGIALIFVGGWYLGRRARRPKAVQPVARDRNDYSDEKDVKVDRSNSNRRELDGRELDGRELDGNAVSDLPGVTAPRELDDSIVYLMRKS